MWGVVLNGMSGAKKAWSEGDFIQVTRLSMKLWSGKRNFATRLIWQASQIQKSLRMCQKSYHQNMIRGLRMIPTLRKAGNLSINFHFYELIIINNLLKFFAFLLFQKRICSSLSLSGSFLPLTRALATKASEFPYLTYWSIFRPMALSSLRKIYLACLALWA